MNKKQVFEITTKGSIVYQIEELFNSNELDIVHELEADDSQLFSNRPVGLDPIVTIILTVVVEKSIELSIDYVRKYLAKKTNQNKEEIVVKDKSSEEE
jgi:hypothetical protein